MNEWLKKVTTKLKGLWSKWKPVQKVILIGIILIVIVAIIVLARVSAKPATVKVYTTPITNEEQLQKITQRIDEEGIKSYVNNGIISVDDEKTAKKVRTILVSENIAAPNPFSNFYKRDWSTTDSDQVVKLNKALQEELRQCILTNEGIRDAAVIITRPEDKLFSSDQRAVTAFVKIKADPNSDYYTNRKKILGLQRMVLAAVEGLNEENLVINDWESNQLNDFEGMAESDAVDIVGKQQKLIHKLEIQYGGEILENLQRIYGVDRIRGLNLKIDMDMSKKKSTANIITPIEVTPDNPDTPFDDSEKVLSIEVGSQRVTEEFNGTGYNPQGPAGVEGQTAAPSMVDMSNVIGHSKKVGETVNNVYNEKQIQEETAPKIGKITVSVNVDGTWKTKRNPQTGKVEIDDYGAFVRDYIPPTENELVQVKDYIKDAIGFDKLAGYSVSVTSIQIDRSKQFAEEEAEYWAAIQRRRTIFMVLIAVVVVLIGFILFRIISRELERRRREKEARMLAEQQAARERALWEAKDEGMEVTMSVEETRRMELQENAVTMAKEHPEDVAMLIRTWLMEE